MSFLFFDAIVEERGAARSKWTGAENVDPVERMEGVVRGSGTNNVQLVGETAAWSQGG